MDWGLYVLIDVLVIGLGLLSYQDRLFGVAGVLIGFLGGAYVYGDATTGITFNSGYSETGANVIPYLIIIFVLVILDIAILMSITHEMNKSNNSD